MRCLCVLLVRSHLQKELCRSARPSIITVSMLIDPRATFSIQLTLLIKIPKKYIHDCCKMNERRVSIILCRLALISYMGRLSSKKYLTACCFKESHDRLRKRLKGCFAWKIQAITSYPSKIPRLLKTFPRFRAYFMQQVVVNIKKNSSKENGIKPIDIWNFVKILYYI